MVEKIVNENIILGLIIRDGYENEGVTFFTSPEDSQQLAYMKHPKGHSILPHIHNEVKREVLYTNEVLIIKKGSLRIDFYNSQKIYLESRILNQGDVVLLMSGGHGFVALDNLEMYEVKQGPFVGTSDKVRFEPVDVSDIKLK